MPSSSTAPLFREHCIITGHAEHRLDVFDSTATAAAAEKAFTDICVLHRWSVHAYVFLQNRFQFAVTMPAPTTPDPGLRMLEDILAPRLIDRDRGRFRLRHSAYVVHDAAVFVNRIDQIHLEPVRLGRTAPGHLAAFAASSLRQLLQTPRPAWLSCTELLRLHQLTDTTAGWSTYLARLMHTATTSEPPVVHSSSLVFAAAKRL